MVADFVTQALYEMDQSRRAIEELIRHAAIKPKREGYYFRQAQGITYRWAFQSQPTSREARDE